ncbi:MAG: ADP-forming succinate--CoA ligase subunit beta [Holosporales bacterium]
MNIHEYQSKNLLKDFGIAVQRGQVAETVNKAFEIAKNLEGDLWVLKAQIHAGGRGKGGGVKLAHSLEEVRDFAQQMIGMQLVTPQTGPKGQKVRDLYVVEAANFQQEYYLSVLLDRKVARLTFVVSPEGGMDIEELAEKSPEKILSVAIDPVAGFQEFYGRRLAHFMGFEGHLARKFIVFLKAIYQAFVRLDASLIEINPLVLTMEGEFLALDAKMTFDDNALFRHPQIQVLRDLNEEEALEIEAAKAHLNYIKLDGNIACMVNGAGLAMATMDLIQLHGGHPANFLDVGGGASKDQVVAAFKILLADPSVEAVLVNIFGGIMRCDVIAQGIIEAAQEVNLSLPLVVRLMGTNVDQGRELLKNSGLALEAVMDLKEAAERVVMAAKQNKEGK